MGTIINRATMLTVQAIMLIAVVWGFTYTAKLDVTTHSIPPLDDVLLYVAVPMFYLNFIFSMAASVYFGNGLYIAYIVVMVSIVNSTKLYYLFFVYLYNNPLIICYSNFFNCCFLFF